MACWSFGLHPANRRLVLWCVAEQVRLGLSPDEPLAVQQWQGLIAVNYAARKAGIKRYAIVVFQSPIALSVLPSCGHRHCTASEAKKLCPGSSTVSLERRRIDTAVPLSSDMLCSPDRIETGSCGHLHARQVIRLPREPEQAYAQGQFGAVSQGQCTDIPDSAWELWSCSESQRR